MNKSVILVMVVFALFCGFVFAADTDNSGSVVQPVMTPSQALSNMTAVCNKYKGTLQEHMILLESARVLTESLKRLDELEKKTTAKPVDDKPAQPVAAEQEKAK